MKDLERLRAELDTVDRELVGLFERRMLLACQVAVYKRAHELPVLDASREERVIASRTAMLTDSRWSEYVRALYQEIMALSRGAQERCLREAHGHD